MASSGDIHCETIAKNLNEPISLQFDEESQLIYVLTNYQLTQIDLKKQFHVEIVRQHNRKLNGIHKEGDEYSQDEEDNEDEMEDPFEDSEPSTDDDEEATKNRRSWRREGWRFYRLDNPTSILFLSNLQQLIVLNEGVFTVLKIQSENQYPFVQGPSTNIFCSDFDVFEKPSVRPWSIAQTSTEGFYLFSLLDSVQIYSLDLTNENPIIEKFVTTSISQRLYLIYHPKFNQVFICNSKEVFSISLNHRTINPADLSFLPEEKSISTIAVDQNDFIYILSNSVIFKCSYQSELYLIQSLGKIDRSISCPNMIVNHQGNEFYFSDIENNCIYRSPILQQEI